jgi:hypothetical protein
MATCIITRIDDCDTRREVAENVGLSEALLL